MLITGTSNRALACDHANYLTVSANDEVRDDLRNVVRGHLSDKVRFFELDYQPS